MRDRPSVDPKLHQLDLEHLIRLRRNSQNQVVILFITVSIKSLILSCGSSRSNILGEVRAAETANDLLSRLKDFKGQFTFKLRYNM